MSINNFKIINLNARPWNGDEIKLSTKQKSQPALMIKIKKAKQKLSRFLFALNFEAHRIFCLSNVAKE